jgi:hypothetical protein
VFSRCDGGLDRGPPLREQLLKYHGFGKNQAANLFFAISGPMPVGPTVVLFRHTSATRRIAAETPSKLPFPPDGQSVKFIRHSVKSFRVIALR